MNRLLKMIKGIAKKDVEKKWYTALMITESGVRYKASVQATGIEEARDMILKDAAKGNTIIGINVNED